MPNKTNSSRRGIFQRPGFAYIVRYLRPYKLAVAGAIIALIFTSGITLTIVQSIKFLVDSGFSSEAESENLLKVAIATFSVLIMLLSIGTFARFFLVLWLAERISADIRTEVFSHAINLHPGYFEEHSTSEINTRITTDTTILQTIIGSSVSIALRNMLIFIGGIILLVIGNPKLAIIVVICAITVILPIFILGRRIRSLANKGQARLADVGVCISESLRYIKTLQATNHQHESQQYLKDKVEQTFRVGVIRIRQRAILITAVIWLMLASIVVMLWFGGQAVIANSMTSGELVAFIFYTFLVASSAGSLSEVYSDLQRASGAMERLMEILKTKSLLPIAPQPVPLAKEFNSILQFQDVTFSYNTRPDVRVLNNICFNILPGEKVALVGPSGAGKSTLFDLILRFYDPSAGSVLFQDLDLRQLLLQDFRQHISIVPQNPAMFTGSILSNITYSKSNASPAAIAQAVTIGNVLEFTERLPQGLDTTIGEDGIQLSGGQKQRIAIARAALQNPKLLLLDEATSSLDAENERLVQQGLNQLTHGCTTLIIAHRMSTVRKVDRILVLDKGCLVAEGDHQTLMQQSELYKQLTTLQFLSSEDMLKYN